MRKPSPAARQAVGAAEAAAIMGVHWSTPARMVQKGLISAHECDPRSPGTQGLKVVAIYDGLECEENYLDYQKNGPECRPRAHLHQRDEVIDHLAAVEKPIAFSDACGAGEAAAILKVHASFLTRLVEAGEIVGRAPWNPRARGGGTRNWIFSRESCYSNVAKAAKLAAGGKKHGRPRRFY